MVWLIDATDERLGGALTDATGRFTLRAPAPGRYRLRAERIGFAGTTSPVIELAAGQTLDYELAASAEAIALPEITVEAEERCVVRPEDGGAAARLWEEARKALEAAVWSEEQQTYMFQVVSYERELDPGSLVVRSEERTGQSLFSRNPIRSRPAEDLAAEGYIRPHGDGSWDVYAPDAEALLSDAFLDGHCFRVVAGRGENEGLAGLAFEPVRDGELPDVTGVLWLDPASAALRHLEVHYTRLPAALRGRSPTGRAEFERLPNGAWFVRRWWIRSPMFVIETGGPAVLGNRRIRVDGLLEMGGAVVAVDDGAGRGVVAAGPRASLTGVVYDSTRAAPLAGAEVFLSGTGHRTVADAAGRFRLDGLPEGTYSASFLHPRLDSLGVYATPRAVRLTAGGVAEVRLFLPSFATLLAGACVADEAAEADEPTGAVIGTVRDAATGRPLRGARVVLRWPRSTQLRQSTTSIVTVEWEGVAIETDARGGFRACGVPAGGRIAARAVAGERRGPERAFQLDADETAELTLEVGDVSAARRAGVVDVAARPGATAEDPVALDEITVTAAADVPAPRLDRVGFYDRERTTTGEFIDRAAIERRHAQRVTQILQNVPGVRTVPFERDRTAVYMRGPMNFSGICWPRVYLDGVVLFQGGASAEFIDPVVHPTNLEGIEVYRSAAEVPPQYGGAQSACGVIVLWTRTGEGA